MVLHVIVHHLTTLIGAQQLNHSWNTRQIAKFYLFSASSQGSGIGALIVLSDKGEHLTRHTKWGGKATNGNPSHLIDSRQFVGLISPR